MDDSPAVLAQNVSRTLDAVARVFEASLTSGNSLNANETRYMLGIVKDAQRDITPLAYPKLEVVR